MSSLIWSITLALGILALDLALPLGVAGGMPYVAVVLLSLWARPRDTYVSAAVCSGLTVVGFFLSPPGGTVWVVLLNRVYALVAIWITALLIIRYRHSQHDASTAQDKAQTVSALNLRLEQSEQQLREQRDELDQLYRTAPAGLALLDRDFRFVRVNDRLALNHGLPAAEHAGRAVHDILPEDVANAGQVLFRRVIDSGEPVLNVELSGAVSATTGQDGHWLANYHPVFAEDGTVQGVSLSVQDITARKEAEQALRLAHDNLEARVTERTHELTHASEALRASEALYRTLAETAQDMIFIVSPNARFEYVNSYFANTFGLDVEAVRGHPIEEFVPPEVAASQRRSVLQVYETGRALDVERLTPLPTGPRWFAARLVPIKDAAGNVTSVLGVARDVTDQKRVEAQMRQSQQLETVGRLAGGIAHDFNNLLLVIGGHTDDLLRDANVPASARLLLEETRATTHRAAELTRQLLAFGRRQVLLPTAVDLRDVVRSIYVMLNRVISEDIRIEMTLSAPLSLVKVDPAQVEQVLLNLALNARDAMPSGGSLQIEVTNFDVSEPMAVSPSSTDVVPPGAYVMMVVRDNGIGMEKDIADKVFEPFFTTKAPDKGSGLGLSTVYGILRQSGGFVWVESEPGSGTAVHVLLPTTAEAMVPAETVCWPEQPARGAGTVLLVEDQTDIRELLSDWLSEAGYDVVGKADGHEAIQAFPEIADRLEVVVTDVVMPNVSGPTLVRTVRQQREDVKALYVSGYADDRMTAEIEGDPLSGYLQKPFSREQLLRKISELTSK